MVEIAGFDEIAYRAARLCDHPLPGVCRFGRWRHLRLHRQLSRTPIKASMLSEQPLRHMVRHQAVGLGLTTTSRGDARADPLGLAVDRGDTMGEGGEIGARSEEHTSELMSLMHNSYAVFELKNKKITT